MQGKIKHVNGLSLMELLVVLCIISSTVFFGARFVLQWQQKLLLQLAYHNFRMELEQLRALAIATEQSWFTCPFDIDTQKCLETSSTWFVFSEASWHSAHQSERVPARQFALDNAIEVNLNREMIRFARAASGASSAMTIALCHKQYQGLGYEITISNQGRIRASKNQGGMCHLDDELAE